MPKQPYYERPDGASLAFLRRVSTPINRLDRFEDCLDVCIFRSEDDFEQQIAHLMESWTFWTRVHEQATAHPADVRALMLLARWYHGLNKDGRRIAFAEIRREVYAMPELTDPFGKPVTPTKRVARDDARHAENYRRLHGGYDRRLYSEHIPHRVEQG